MSAASRSTCDAIVVGGGPAGSTTAILLAQAGYQVALIEKAAFPRRKVCGEFISATTWPLLRELGVAGQLLRLAGPAVRRVGVFVESSQVVAVMPRPVDDDDSYGRAVQREVLDSALLARAVEVGATVWQPWAATSFKSEGSANRISLRHCKTGSTHIIEAPLVIAAHGSWEAGPLPGQANRQPARPSDLLGFKTHFQGGKLDNDLMPLISFPGGYGGLVNTGEGRLSLSCCIRRDTLVECRVRWPDRTAGQALLCHIAEHCVGVATVLLQAECDGSWLAAGPIRPGTRDFGRGGVFPVGNATGEAHPVIAEGISIAIQSAALLCDALSACRGESPTAASLDAARRQYAVSWRRNFEPRMRASALYAHIFMNPVSARAAMSIMRLLPSVLRVGSGWSGKSRTLQSARRELVS